MLRVILKPLIPQIPLFGGIQVFFLNSPTLDFNLIGVADVFDMPGLKYLTFNLNFEKTKSVDLNNGTLCQTIVFYFDSGIFRRVIIDQIGALLVLPNKLCIPLSDGVSSDEIRIAEPAVSMTR